MTTLVLGLLVPMLAGAMLYVVVEELIPEASNGQHTNLSTRYPPTMLSTSWVPPFFAVGFILMMLLDVMLG